MRFVLPKLTLTSVKLTKPSQHTQGRSWMWLGSGASKKGSLSICFFSEPDRATQAHPKDVFFLFLQTYREPTGAFPKLMTPALYLTSNGNPGSTLKSAIPTTFCFFVLKASRTDCSFSFLSPDSRVIRIKAEHCHSTLLTVMCAYLGIN